MTESAKKTDSRKERRSLRRDVKGAVLAEFIVAIFPLLAVFFVFVQFSMLAISSLIVKHATVVGARAASVYSNKNGNTPEMCNDKGEQKVKDAVRAALGPWSNRITPTTEITDTSGTDGDAVYDLVTVKVTAQVRCNVPMGKAICGFTGYKQIEDIKSMPHQGARYKSGSCGGGG